MTQAVDFVGVRVDGGVMAFQIVQQDAQGRGTFSLHGRWQHPEGKAAGLVQLRVLREDDAQCVVPWQNARAQDAATWKHTLEGVPAGGLYRIETRLCPDPLNAEWSPHGDFVHHLGVGDLWIIAGQSNAAGYGRGSVSDPPRLGVHVLKNDETWDIATHVLNETTRSGHPNLEASNPAHSPYLRFAKDLHDALGYPIGLIQTALGGSPLSMWNPVENPAAPLYKNLLHCVHLAGGQTKGMVWYQGCSDASPEQAPTYERRFGEFIATLRRDLKDEHFPVVLAQLNRCTNPADVPNQRNWSIVREAQRQAVKLGHVAVVSTLDLALSDLIHTSPDANLTLGRRKAQAALAMVYGRGRPASGLRLSAAARDAEGKTITLTFAEVTNRVSFQGPGEHDFTVEDQEGFVKASTATVSARDQVQLTLERALVGPATLSGGFGVYPACNLRDAEDNVPILAFYAWPVR